MRLLPLLLLAAAATTTATLAASCNAPRGADLGLSMSAPQGLLDSASDVKLYIFAAKDHACDPATGHAGDTAGTKPTTLVKDKCGAGTWCADDITLDQDGSTKTFYVEVTDANATRLAEGCTTEKIDQDPLEVSIKIVRYVVPGCCGNGSVEIGELCDNGGSPTCGGTMASEVCAADCSAAEIPLDYKTGGAGHAPGDETGVALSFATGNGQLTNGLRAAFQDKAPGSPNIPDVDIRFMKSDLTTVTSPALQSGPLRIPLNCAAPSGPGEARQNFEPQIATLGGTTSAVVFTGDKATPQNFDIYVSLLDDKQGCATKAALLVNGTPSGCSHPDVAEGPGSEGLIVWAQGGNVKARTVDASGTFGAELSVAPGKDPRVAGTPGGWLVVYEGAGGGDDDGILVRSISSAGIVGSETLVNSKTGGVQDQADIATQSDGRSVVVFHSEGDVYFQRYDSAGTAVSGDQAGPIHAIADGEQANPAASAGTNDFFVVAWEDGGSIRARYLGSSSGFVFNDVDGQNTDFLASSPGIAGDRHKPAVAYGGDGYVVFAWDDQSAGHPGVFASRFPTPQ